MTTAIKCPDFLTHVKGLKEWWVYTIETDNPSCGKLTTSQPGGISQLPSTSWSSAWAMFLSPGSRLRSVCVFSRNVRWLPM